ncbi:4-cresol dehydrogenase [hydroxylating] flavoprotein subunit [Enhygromyxa salina]|uniref:4-cresol dehydrogenase [hydroxylating] flavoprotein subunit n=1 Tax=Enhygromyxa salina TaxID=215803 RepID=A0A2S9XXF4_9BACT|nr:FAD-binding protein [Enhygromyxa salina]PRP97401.1 4-cresol dehydrogenase [hydroxylating] flavoprotein subunit [Enhygromyxa salina]
MTVARDRLSAALAAWSSTLGVDGVETRARELEAAETATYATASRVLAILRPRTRAEVQACVRVAAEHGVPLYPTSTGKNWGYGSRVPTTDGAVVLELGGLDRILELDEELGYVVIEPGVTQRQLHDFVREQTGGRLWIDATSSSFDSSVIGNLLERGHGVTAYCDHVACASDLEVVLADGEVICTGYGAFGGEHPESATRALDSWGLGPALAGLFSQSNFGVVTRATIWLMRAPEYARVGFFTVEGDDALAAAVDAIRPLRLDRILPSGPFFGNVYQALRKVMSYPWAATGGAVPLDSTTAEALAAPHRYGRWNGSIGLCGTVEQVELQQRRLEAALAGRASWSCFVDASLAGLEREFPASRHAEVRAVVAGFTGGVAGTGLRGAYWRVGDPPTSEAMDLDRDGCGFKFTTATVPFRGAELLAAARYACEVISSHGFEPGIGVFPVRERALQLHISTAYDRRVEGHDAAALACHAALAAGLMDRGYFPTRLGVGSMDALTRQTPRYGELLGALKRVFDPCGILAPGRYAAEPAGSPLLSMTDAEHCALEREAPREHRYIAGKVPAMAGGTLEHSRLVAELGSMLRDALEGGPCRVLTADARIRIEAVDVDTYPDLAVVHGPPKVAADTHALLNPTLIVEVLARSTEAYDRGLKASYFRRIPSLQAYLLVAQDRPLLELQVRERGDRWALLEAGPGQRLTIEALELELEVDAIYREALSA